MSPIRFVIRLLAVGPLCVVPAIAPQLAQAQQVHRLQVGAAISPPTLGFYGHVEWGRGMVIDSVTWGSLAQRIGLERGDVISQINGYAINSVFDYDAAIRARGGRVLMYVQDVRGRGTIPVAFDWTPAIASPTVFRMSR